MSRSMKVLWRIVRRSAILFLLGLFVINQSGSPVTHRPPNPEFDFSGGKRWSELRVPGVLQRFAVGYLVVAGARALAKPATPTDEQVRDPIGTDSMRSLIGRWIWNRLRACGRPSGSVAGSGCSWWLAWSGSGWR